MYLMRIFHIIIGSHVEGQVFLPSGQTLRCYDIDSTCTTITNIKELDYAQDGEFQRSKDNKYSYCLRMHIIYIIYMCVHECCTCVRVGVFIYLYVC